MALYSTLFAFGDSLSDAGNLYAADGGTAPVSPYDAGHFSNGPTWVEDLSGMLGLGTLTPSLKGGNDFAFGGAQTGTTAIEGLSAIDLPAQIAEYAVSHPTRVAGALYTLDIGANDIINALDDFAAGKISLGGVNTVVTEAENNTVHAVDALYLLGARNLLFYEVPNLGLTPLFEGTSLQGLASCLAQSFDQTVLADVAPLERFGFKVFDLHTYALLGEIERDPAAFGFTNVTTPVWTGNFTSSASGTLASTNPSVQNQYLFWDHLHPTAAGHQLTADFAYDLLTGRPGTSIVGVSHPMAFSIG
jgi:phospholipase/lecithinase/hemolysin